ncbi:hypothetical protein BC827DRAFT_710872 [Russula dissimulans]|nr:hypothetical protein BC827DRAFT_710872 [Russula dissimulans]
MSARRGSSDAAGVELSVSRINRLLRPLRNKCAILASTISRPSGSVVSITYGCGSLPLLARAPPPLDVLRDPKFIISHAHQESRSMDALARRICAVTNAYHNVVQTALQRGQDEERRNVLALTDICAASIGKNIRREVARCLATDEEEPVEIKETALVDELYESVPTRFRSWTLITHATSEIVDTCPAHPMLMLSLFGVALTRGLYSESKTFLRLFLTSLIRSPRCGIPPPITHPLYPSYLVGLFNEWTGLAPGPLAGLFTHRSFVTVTLEVLTEHGSAKAWTCKSITRLVQLLRTLDFGCFLTFLHGLIDTLAARPGHLVHDHEDDHLLLARLAKWTGVITSDFFSISNREPCGAAHAQQFHTIIDILASAYDAGLHLSIIDATLEDDRGARDPQGALVCVATHCLSSSLFSTVNAPHQRAILALLRDVAPTSTTVGALATQPFTRLRTLAGTLRAHGLSALERALWACAVEYSSHSLHVDPALPALRRALIDASESERRREDDIIAGEGRMRGAESTRSPPRKRARREMARCSEPGRRRRRLQQQQPQPQPQRLPSPSPSSSSTTVSASSTLSPYSSSSLSAMSLAGVEGPIEIAESSEDEGETTRRPHIAARDFKSAFIIMDALRTRENLKEERRCASLRAACRYDRSVSSGGYSCEEEAVTPALASESDLLDLFAYDELF